MTFQDIFHSNNSHQDKFLSRVFGIFSEEIVRCWAMLQSPYSDLGRPTLKRLFTESRGHTLDFTFQSQDGGVYVVEMKCELEYENYKYLVLEKPSQLDHHVNPNVDNAFKKFLDAAQNPSEFIVNVNGKRQAIDGAILVWGSCSPAGRISVMEHYKFKDIISVETIIHDLLQWQNQEYLEMIHTYDSWCSSLFSGLKSLTSD